MKLFILYVLVMLLGKCGFLENRYSEIHTLLKDVNEMHFLHFYLVWMKFGTCNIHNSLVDCDFRENRHSKSHIFLRDIHEPCSYFAHLFSILGEVRRKRSADNAICHSLIL
jgi:hypothetical protein